MRFAIALLLYQHGFSRRSAVETASRIEREFGEIKYPKWCRPLHPFLFGSRNKTAQWIAEFLADGTIRLLTQDFSNYQEPKPLKSSSTRRKKKSPSFKKGRVEEEEEDLEPSFQAMNKADELVSLEQAPLKELKLASSSPENASSLGRVTLDLHKIVASVDRSFGKANQDRKEREDEAMLLKSSRNRQRRIHRP